MRSLLYLIRTGWMQLAGTKLIFGPNDHVATSDGKARVSWRLHAGMTWLAKAKSGVYISS